MSAQTQPDFGATTSGGVLDVNYGLLYNWYAATDIRNIAAAGWHIPTNNELITLQTYAGTVGGSAKLREIGVMYWGVNTTPTNEHKFNARGAGYRVGISGSYTNLMFDIYIISSYNYGSETIILSITGSNNDPSIIPTDKKDGVSIRLLKDTTTLTHGQTGTYVGNDGKVYRTICIGTQEWLADNLCETLYRDLTPIPEVTDNAAWAALTTGALCAYNNDWGNV